MTNSNSKLVALLAALALIAAACSSDEVDRTAPADEPEQIEPEVIGVEDQEPATTTTTLGVSEFAGSEILVAVRDNPTMNLIQGLTQDFFTDPTGIEVTFVNIDDLDVEDVREVVIVDTGLGTDFDVVMIDPFNAPQLGDGGWLLDLAPTAAEDDSFELDGFIPSLLAANSVNDELYAVPFSAASSIIMFNEQIMDDAGIDFPREPTWERVAEIARQLDTDDTTGICLNGVPEWDELGAVLTTVANTFGGAWWEANEDGTPGPAQINQRDSAFRAATNFYFDLTGDAGPDNLTETGFEECLEQFQSGEVAIWFDSTSAAPLLEAADSPIAGDVGYARAPIFLTDASGGLSTWGLAATTGKAVLHPEASWEFIRWATSSDTIQLLGENAPDAWGDPGVQGAATRLSHLDIPDFREAAESYADVVFDELNAADPNNPGTTPRPGLPGVQYVGIPEFPEIAGQCVIVLSEAVRGTISVDGALDNCQTIASEVPVLSATTAQPNFAGTTIQVAVFDHPTMDIIRTLSDEFFTGPTGIEVEFVTLREQTLREISSVDARIFSPDDFEIVMIGSFEASQFGVNGWTMDLAPEAAGNVEFDLDGFLPSVLDVNSSDEDFRGDLVDEMRLFAVPFYAESSIIMYNQQIIDDAGINFPEDPTWQQVADIARQLDTDETSGICLRGRPGWGDFGAALTTVVNTFGGTWWEANEDGTVGEAQINQPASGFRAATEFYLKLAIDAGPGNFAETGFDQCLEQFQNGNAAIWYDTTEAPALLEASNSPIAGNVGYARAPIDQTDASGSLWTWGLATLQTGFEPEASWEFIRWATSPETIRLIAENAPDGWSDPGVVGAATRSSHFDIPEFREATEPYGDIIFDELNAADPNNPGTTPRPGLPGVQYVGIPEFQQVATDCTTELAAAEGTISIDEALDNCQAIASEVTQ